MKAAELILEINLFCVVIMGYILIRLIIRDDRQISQVKFRNMVMWHIVLLLINGIGEYVSNIIAIGNARVTVAIMSIYYITLNMAIRSWLIYYTYSVNLPDKKRINTVKLINAGSAVFVFLNATTEFTHILYYSDGGRIFRAGTYYIQWIYLFGIQLVITAAYYYYAHSQLTRAERKMAYLIGSYPIVLVIFLFIRHTVGNFPFMAISNTIAVLVIYIGYLDNVISIDPLTDINNRSSMYEYIQKKIDEKPENLSLIMIDINEFKNINDKFGHIEGDKALKIVAGTMKKIVLENYRSGFLGRFGGDEFIVVIENDKEKAGILAERIRSSIQKASVDNNLKYDISLSMGITQLNESIGNAENLISAADEEMYKNKKLMKSRMKSAVK